MPPEYFAGKMVPGKLRELLIFCSAKQSRKSKAEKKELMSLYKI